MFPQRSRPALLMPAAWGGLKSAPDSRLRRASRHLLYSLLRRTMIEPHRVADDVGCLREELARATRDRDRWKRRSERLKQQLDAARRAGFRQAAPFAKDCPQGRGGRPGRRAGTTYGRRGRRPIPARVSARGVSLRVLTGQGAQIPAANHAERLAARRRSLLASHSRRAYWWRRPVRVGPTPLCLLMLAGQWRPAQG